MTLRAATLFWVFLYACSRGGGGRPLAQSLHSDSVRVNQAATPAPEQPVTGPPGCSRGPGPLRISEDSIGPLPIHITIATLKAACPTSQDSVLYGHESMTSAVLLPFE